MDFPTRSCTRQVYSLFSLLFNIGVLANAIRENKTIRGIRIGRENLQFCRWHDMMKTQGKQEENQQNYKSIQ